MTTELKNILILDDEIESPRYSGLKENMDEEIRKAGYKPLFETDSAKGLKLIETYAANNITLVFLDLQFHNQKLQGEDLLAAIRKDPKIKVPIVVFSTKPRDTRSKEMQGALFYEEKQFNIAKNEFSSAPNNVRNLIIRSQNLENRDCTLTVDCLATKISLNSTLFPKNPIEYKFEHVSPSFITDDIALNENTFLFKLIYNAPSEHKNINVHDCFSKKRIFKTVKQVKKTLSGKTITDSEVQNRISDLAKKYFNGEQLAASLIEDLTEDINYSKIVSRFNENIRLQSGNRILELIRGGSGGQSGRPKKGSGTGAYSLIVNEIQRKNCDEGLPMLPQSIKRETFVSFDDFMKLQEKVALLEKEIKFLKKQK